MKKRKVLKTIVLFVCFILISGSFSMIPFTSKAITEVFTLGETSTTQFTNANGVSQDGNVAMYRDNAGYLWAVFGRSNSGITVWKGTNINNLTKQYSSSLNFSVGAAGTAFNNINYPDGPMSRGQLWIQGLYIDNSGTFYCYIHNETGWEAGGTGYTLNANFEGEPDFRHIGLMTSTDQGMSWSFVNWMVTSNTNSYTTTYQPDGGGFSNPQAGPTYCLGAADQSLFVNSNDSYIYMFYSMIFCDINGASPSDYTYVARALKSNPTVWYKYYNGNWTEAGNRGLETAIAGPNVAVPSVAYSTYLGKYIMTSYNRASWSAGQCPAQIATSTDLVNWSYPQLLKTSDTTTVKPYWSIFSSESTGSIKDVGQSFTLLYNQFGDDIRKTQTSIQNGVDSSVASANFSSTQGQGSWYYKQWNGTAFSDMTWDGANGYWIGSSSLVINAANWQHPDTNDSARAYKTPYRGDIVITSNTPITSDSGGDGINVKIMNGTTQVWPASGWQYIASGTPFNFPALNLTVNANDYIYFIVNKNGNNWYDHTVWDPVIAYSNYYTASSGFSSTQGSNNWSYKEANGSTYTDMTWDSTNGNFKGSTALCIAASNYQHPDTYDSARVFTAPKSGNVIISTNGNITTDSGSGGDGVNLKIIKNTTQIWPASGWQNVATGASYAFTTIQTSVSTGDKIYFIVNKNGNNWYDRTVWNQVVLYMPSYKASTGFSSIQGQSNWYYKQLSGTTYSNMTWSSAYSYWVGAEAMCIIKNNQQHPATNDSVRTFLAPLTGSITITANGNLSLVTGGDGVRVKIMKNTTKIWPSTTWKTISAGGSLAFSALTVSVTKGDLLYFVENKNSNNNYDTLTWDPIITYNNN